MLLLSGLPFFERLAEGVSRITVKIGRIEFGCLNLFAGIVGRDLLLLALPSQSSVGVLPNLRDHEAAGRSCEAGGFPHSGTF